jgi:hypothetical protein
MLSSLSLTWPSLPFGWVLFVLAVAGGLLLLLLHGTILLQHRGVPARWLTALGCVRLVMIFLFVLILLQPVLLLTRQVERPAEMLVLIDTSQSMDQPGSGSETRFEEVLPHLENGNLTSTLAQRFKLHWFAFDRTATPVEKNALSRLRPIGDGTLYSESLQSAWNYLAQTGAAPERVLLISDGRDQGSPDLVETAQRLGVIVDVLAPGSQSQKTNPDNDPTLQVGIRDVQAARRVLLGSETHFQVTLQCPRVSEEHQVKLILSEKGKEPQSRLVAVGRGRTEERVRFAHRPGETGVKTYEFRVQLANGKETPPTAVSVQVVDGKNEVLILEDSWRWEFKYLRRVLEEDPSFRFTALLSRGGGTFMQFASPDRRLPLVGFPRNRGQLNGVDTLILGDIDPRRWPKELAPAVRDMVVEDGRSLVVLAGPNLIHWLEAPDLLALLPVEITRETATPVSGPVPTRLSPEGARSALFFQAEGAAAFPPLDQIYPPLRKKPAATVLVEATEQANAYGPVIVIAEQTVGRGRVVFIGTDTLWKWHMLGAAKEGEMTAHRLFWQQALRALTPTLPRGGAVNLWLQPERSRYEAGQRAVVRAEIDAPKSLTGGALQAEVTLPGGQKLPLTFAPEADTPGMQVAEFETNQIGAYQINARVLSQEKPLAFSTTVIDVEEAHGERDSAPVDLANLTRIAASTGGVVLDPDKPETWPTSSVRERPRITQTTTIDLWNSYTLLLLLGLIMGVDWFLRLFRGYV